MTPAKLAPQDLLYHPVHGLCRVERVTEREKGISYSLVPRAANRMKVRFWVAAQDLEAVGFHKVITAKEANRILQYLKAGDRGAERTDRTWALARNILSFTQDTLNSRDQRGRQLMEHSVKGLAGEFSCVLKISLEKAVGKIRRSLGANTTVPPLLCAALTRAAEN